MLEFSATLFPSLLLVVSFDMTFAFTLAEESFVFIVLLLLIVLLAFVVLLAVSLDSWALVLDAADTLDVLFEIELELLTDDTDDVVVLFADATS